MRHPCKINLMKAPSFELIKKFVSTYGAMSVAEGIALYNVCLQAPDYGNWIELGSHKGRSSIMIASNINNKINLTLVEPEFSSISWANEVHDKLEEFNKNRNITFFANYSTEVLPDFEEISFLFVDSGNHGEQIVQSEKPLYEDKIISGGIIAFHDYGEKSQFTAVKKCYEELVATGKYEPIEINWDEIFEYVKENDLKDGAFSWHIYPELPHPPNFIGALRRK